ncbi:MAG: methylenetetrahydrofolate reductase [NAD(P)H] [Actinobacteria bacterium]|uniref:methylenetetrahydrofolate reductase (NADH) n=1 Tax=freshwater metagenome TaxID=449393 RepID=A0A6J7VRL9_9ZZZZ|nr:methylenetetrahydrofolate reductase [NAD(P)H] [Actinomycetota bacterium]
MVVRTSYSLEFFPPKDGEGELRLWSALEELEHIAPEFVSVTYGAGGSTRNRTIGVTEEVTHRTKIPTVAHLTCVGSSRQELISILHMYRNAGIRGVLALRGDPAGGPRAPWTPTSDGFTHADELVQLIHEFGGFDIGVAAFPDGHPSSLGDSKKDVDVLLRKEHLGATFATTQFFFEVAKWEQLVYALQARGSKMPIIPGILPITNVKQLHRMAELGGTPIPPSVSEAFSKVEDDSDAVHALGIELASNLCEDLLRAGAPSLHFYTMNSATATNQIYRNLNNAH